LKTTNFKHKELFPVSGPFLHLGTTTLLHRTQLRFTLMKQSFHWSYMSKVGRSPWFIGIITGTSKKGRKFISSTPSCREANSHSASQGISHLLWNL